MALAQFKHGHHKGHPAVDNAAQRFALGVFKTHPLVYLKQDTASLPEIVRLNAKAEKAAARLLSLPPTNSAAAIVGEILENPGKTHQAAMHYALHHPASTLSALSGRVEPIFLADALTAPQPRFQTLIAASKEAAALCRTPHQPGGTHRPHAG